MKKILMFFTIMISCLIINTVFAADVEVQINGKIINFEDASAQIINDRTMVPFRKIFKELGVPDENISWESTTKTIIANKDNTQIKLQIGNQIAEKKEGKNSSEIKLDSEPVIRNDRTLVPLRFIAESLGKTVGWDAANKTAVIIDFDYFLNMINEKSSSFYNFINADDSKVSISIVRNYIDDDDPSRNNTANISSKILENRENETKTQNVEVHFSGTNELMKEIASEGWADISFENLYYSDYFTTKALTDGLKKVYGQEQLKFLYDGLKCKGKNTDTLIELLKNICNINDKQITIETFDTLKNELDNFLKLFKVNSDGSLGTGNIGSEIIELNNFDFTKLDNVIYDSSINRVYSFLNTQIFNYDVTLEELLYDYPNLNITINTNNLDLAVDFILSNQYNEKVEYFIKISKGE